jgi:peroxiredoxin
VAAQPASANEQATARRFGDLLGVDGERHSLARLAGDRATVLVFTSGSCPTARSYEDRLIGLAARWHRAGVALVAINSNNPHLSPPDTVDAMARRSAMRGFNFPYLKDAGGAVARSYGVACTPTAVVLDANLAVVYTGRIDDSRTGAAIGSRDLEDAVADTVAGRPVATGKTEPFGCSIIW